MNNLVYEMKIFSDMATFELINASNLCVILKIDGYALNEVYDKYEVIDYY